MPGEDIIYYNVLSTPCGTMYLADRGGKICLCDWRCPTNATEGTTSLLEEAIRQVELYFNGKLRYFRLPLEPDGTSFRLRVWEAIAAIPYGATISYRELAETIGRQDAVRAVAGACGANKISLMIPCHRIIGSDGSLTGYAGGMKAKATLLALERRYREI